MPVEIGGIKVPRVHRLTTLEQAAFVHHRVPGQDGNTIQNLGRDSVQLEIEGIFFGPQAKEDLEKLRGLYVKRQPVDFIADLMGQYFTGKVVLTRLDVAQSAQEPQQFSYSLVVAEYVQPPKQGATAQQALANKARLEAKVALDIATLPDALALGSMPEISNPFVPLNDALEPARQATEALVQSMDGLKKLFGA
ncbi:MAG: DNA circularization N-terminal domain-containing protein [Chloroflexota bacterium]